MTDRFDVAVMGILIAAFELYLSSGAKNPWVSRAFAFAGGMVFLATIHRLLK